VIADLKPYSEYKESGLHWLGQVPGHWELKRLKTVGKINPSKSESTSLLRENALATFLPMERVGSDGRIDSREVLPASSLWSGFTYFRRDDVLLAKITPCFENGKGACLSNLPTAIGFGSTEFHVLRPRAALSPRFLYLQTCLAMFRDLGARSMTGSAGQQRVPSRFVEEHQTLIPPPAEQAAIVRFLDWTNERLERAIRAKRKVIALLNEQKQAIIHRAVTRGLDPSAPLKPSGIPWLGDIPQHWEVRRLKSLCRFVTSGSRGWARYYADAGLIFLRIGNISTTSVDLRLKHITYVTPPAGAEGERTRAMPNDLLLAITAQIGAVGIVPERLGEAFVNQHTALIRLRPGESVPRWIAYGLLSQFGKDQCRLMTNGGTKIGLTLDDVRCLVVLLPSRDEQTTIVNDIERQTRALDVAISRLEREIDLLREYCTRLVADVVTGKLDVREAAALLPDEAAPDSDEAAAEVDEETELADEEVAV